MKLPKIEFTESGRRGFNQALAGTCIALSLIHIQIANTSIFPYLQSILYMAGGVMLFKEGWINMGVKEYIIPIISIIGFVFVMSLFGWVLIMVQAIVVSDYTQYDLGKKVKSTELYEEINKESFEGYIIEKPDKDNIVVKVSDNQTIIINKAWVESIEKFTIVKRIEVNESWHTHKHKM